MVDTLTADREPSEALWHSMFVTPGYRFAFWNVQPLRADLELAFRPSRAADRAVASARSDDQALRLSHLLSAGPSRAQLTAFIDSLRRGAPIAQAVAAAARYLPPGITDSVPPPLVAFAIFRDDAYSTGPHSIGVDLLRASNGGLVELLGHEFHHSYLRLSFRMPRLSRDSADALIVDALDNLAAEGMADLIDKPGLLLHPPASLAAYANRYRDEFARAPVTLRGIDSIIARMASDTASIRVAGRKIDGRLWSSGHPVGGYMARTIVDVFGTDSLWSGAVNPVAFVRAYQSAERKRGNPAPLSDATMARLAEARAEISGDLGPSTPEKGASAGPVATRPRNRSPARIVPDAPMGLSTPAARFGLVLCATCIAPHLGLGQRAPVPAVLRSDDGRAALLLSGPAPNGMTIRLIRLPDDSDPAEVVGTHYRVEPVALRLSEPAHLVIDRDSSGFPAGAASNALVVMRQREGEWSTLPADTRGTLITEGGDFAVRWRGRQQCTDDRARALDFRIGTWDYRAEGYDPGQTVVTRDASRCALIERYADVKGGRSASLFIFAAGDSFWHVTTYDPAGRSVMSGQIIPDGVAFYHSPVDREVYRRQTDSTAVFSGERSADGGQTWTSWVTAMYRRAASNPKE